MGKGIRTAPPDALIAASINEDQRGLAFGLHRAGDTAGAFIGLVIAAGIIWATQSGTAELTRFTLGFPEPAGRFGVGTLPPPRGLLKPW